MKTKIYKTIKHSLFIEERDLKNIFDFLKKNYKEIEIKAICIDGSILETKNINEIIEFYNPNYRKIKIIEITAYNNYYNDRVSITIGENNSSLFFSNSAEFFITSETDENARDRTQELIKFFLEIKPFYDWFARFSIFDFVVILWAVIGLSISAGELFGLLPRTENKFSAVEALNYIVIILILVFFITYPIDRFRRWIFPRVFFNIGNQKRTAEKINQWRNIIFKTILLGIFVSLVASLVTKLLL